MTFEKYKSIVDHFEKMTNFFDYVIDTTSMTPEEVIAGVIEYTLTAKSAYDLSSASSSSTSSSTPSSPSTELSSPPKFKVKFDAGVEGDPAVILAVKSTPPPPMDKSGDGKSSTREESVAKESPTSPEPAPGFSDEEMAAASPLGEEEEE